MAEAQLEAQTLTVMNGDGNSSASSYSFNGVDTKTDGTAHAAGTAGIKAVTGATTQDFGQRHLDGINYSFVDGHVKWFKSSSKTSLDKVYNAATPMTTSLQNPTFSVK